MSVAIKILPASELQNVLKGRYRMHTGDITEIH